MTWTRGIITQRDTLLARHAAAAVPDVLGQLLAFCLAGHHAGLGDAALSRRRFFLDPSEGNC